MRGTWILVGLGLMALACGDRRRSMSDFRPQPGDAMRGRRVFVEMRCEACHRVSGEDLPAPVAEPEVPILLGGRVMKAMEDGELADSIANPSRRIAYGDSVGVRSGRLSRMPDYTDTMTVRQMTDLVAFLQAHYEVVPPPAAH